jgi:hypothetical protein
MGVDAMIPLAAYGAHAYLGKKDQKELRGLLKEHSSLNVSAEMVHAMRRTIEVKVCNMLNLCSRCGNKRNYATIKCDHKGG